MHSNFTPGAISSKLRKGNNSSEVAQLINPSNGYREECRKRGVIPRNFERENRLELRKVQKAHRDAKKEAENVIIPPVFKMPRFAQVSSKVNKTANPSLTHAYLKRRASLDPTPERKDASVLQKTRNNIRPTSAPTVRRDTFKKAPIPTTEELHQLDEQLKKMSVHPVNFINNNAKKVIKKQPAERPEKTPDTLRHTSYGRIPHYLIKRQQQWADQETERRKHAQDPTCPKGMKLMQEEKRIETLSLLLDSQKEARRLLLALPLTCETPGKLAKKNTLEGKLKEIEDAILIFDRTRVYIPSK